MNMNMEIMELNQIELIKTYMLEVMNYGIKTNQKLTLNQVFFRDFSKRISKTNTFKHVNF